MSMFCSLSGHVLEEPVINKNTGQVFERRLIEKSIQDTGRDPLTNEPLNMDDLLEVKSNKAVKPRPSPATSIPGMLNLFQNEWDALMLEMHQLRQALGTTRQELSYTLYMQDAATRVIARLARERDEARALAESASQSMAASTQGADGGLANGKRAVSDAEEQPAKRSKAGIPKDVIAAMTELSGTLSKSRKKRVVSPGITTPEALQNFAMLDSHPLHKTTQGGILAVDIAPDDSNMVATGGADGAVHVFDRGSQRIVANLTKHTKKVTGAKFLSTSKTLVSTSSDKTACLWACPPDSTTYSSLRLTDHGADVTALAVHASRDYFVTASADRTWCFYEASTGTCLQQVADDSLESSYTSAAFHPDGLILGTGMHNSTVLVWEVRSQKSVAKFENHRGPVTCLSFSENGYYLATGAADGVKLWDLRKLKNFKSLALEGGVQDLAFDHSGLFLSVAGAEDARVYGSKQEWALLSRFPDLPKRGASAVAWGPEAASLYVGAADHNLRVFGSPAAEPASEPVAMEA